MMRCGQPDQTDALRLRRVALAEALGVKPFFISGMVAAGFPMPGRTATVKEAQKWLQAHPDFVATRALKARTERLKIEREKQALESDSAVIPSRPPAFAGKRGESLLTHG